MDIIKEIIIILLTERKKTTHPCMMDALIQYLRNEDVELWYDGDHISSKRPIKGNGLLLYQYGYEHLVSSFDEMNNLEKSLLEEYINRNLVKDMLQKYE